MAHGSRTGFSFSSCFVSCHFLVASRVVEVAELVGAAGAVAAVACACAHVWTAETRCEGPWSMMGESACALDSWTPYRRWQAGGGQPLLDRSPQGPWATTPAAAAIVAAPSWPAWWQGTWRTRLLCKQTGTVKTAWSRVGGHAARRMHRFTASRPL